MTMFIAFTRTIVTFCVAAPLVASAGSVEVSEREHAVLSAMLIDEVDTWVSGGDGLLSRSGLYPRTDGRQLSAAYDANEVAADQQYKGKTLLVHGSVAAITKDAFGNPYLQLVGHKMFMNAHARFPKESLSALATMTKGQKTILWCKGAGRLMTAAVLDDCVIVDARAQIGMADALLGKWLKGLAGHVELHEFEAQAVFSALMIAQLIPANDTSCSPSGAPRDCLKAVAKYSPTVKTNAKGGAAAAAKATVERLKTSGLAWATKLLEKLAAK